MKNIIFKSQNEILIKKNCKLKFIILVYNILLLLFLYVCYDYLLFKFMISNLYLYENSLNKVYKEHLGEDFDGNYFLDFDKVAMSIFIENIKFEDKYTSILNKKQHDFYSNTIKTKSQDFFLEHIDENSCYIFVPIFSKHTKNSLYDNISKLKKYKNIIIDLRDNPGGSLDNLYKIEDLFLPKNSILGYENTRFKIFSKKIISKKEKFLDFQKIIILQNKNTASSAEGFISGLKENLDNVLTIGEDTYGKGVAQITLPFTSSYSLKFTILNILTPSKNSIHMIGLKPDINYTNPDIIDFAKNKLLYFGN